MATVPLDYYPYALAASPVTAPYVGDGQLWLIDGWAEHPTICADPGTGTTRASGPPVGIFLSAMISDSRGTYLLYNHDMADELLQIRPSQRCAASVVKPPNHEPSHH
ncbi:MAG: hypothetical protein ABSE77_18285 [Acidimicrobiales bacterium]|jgi:hypothetical protein